MFDLSALSKGLSESAMKPFYDKAMMKEREDDPKSEAEDRVRQLNQEKDWQSKEEYDCKLCNNRGFTAKVEERDGFYFVMTPECRCMNIRRAIWRMKQSGLERQIKMKTLANFDHDLLWQEKMLEAAVRYVKDGLKYERWFYCGGQPGCGKTHLCTGIAREILYQMPLQYMVWDSEAKKLKALVNDAEAYNQQIEQFKKVTALYIDDLFKPVRDDMGNRKRPTPADVKLAFEIINSRYVNRLPTIISSEWYIDELADIDEATASRIAEMCGPYQIMISRDRKKN